MKKSVLMTVTIGLIFLIGTAHRQSAAAQAGYRQAPDFSLTDLSGKTIKLADFKGKVLFFNFWATWCPPCRTEIPDFVEVYSQMKAKGLEIIGLSLDSKGRETVSAFIEKYKINYPIVLETRDNTEQIISDFDPGQYIPTTFVIDKQGRIRDKIVGQTDKKELLRYFNQLIAE
jgi:peroxiredoxin